uniref:Si:ch211-132g1.3 n=2 Tax=Cyprinus carpio TaxID=7962 RepID=A0A8C2HV08_CYPCA
MSPRCLMLVAVCVVFISTEAVSGEDVKKAEGDEVSFRPARIDRPVSSIIWKHRGSRYIKAIEWDAEDGFDIPNPRFKDITTLDEKTGEITITKLTVEHSGIYTIDIDSKEQEQRFNLTVTVLKTCRQELLEGTSCTIQLPTRNKEKPSEIRWINLSSGDFIQWKNGTIWTSTTDLTMEEDGSLIFESVSLKNTGKYRYFVFNAEGTLIDAGEKEINIYAKAPKPTLTFQVVTMLSCDVGKRTDLTVSWYVDGKIIQNEKNPVLLLTSAQVQQNKPYTCTASNPVSSRESDGMTLPHETAITEF